MANEVRLIDANALIEKAYWHGERPDPGNIYPDGVEAVDVSDIEDAPTIDPESLRPKGRWELHGNDDDCGCSYFCSNCHISYPEEWFYDHGQYVPFENCPHCTAKMEG